MGTQLHSEIATDSLSTTSRVQPDVIPLWVPAFFGDSNRWLKETQRETYAALAYELFDIARRRYLEVPELATSDQDLAERLRGTVIPEMSFLPRVYRWIAAFYRYGLDRSAAAERTGEERAVRLDRQQAAWEEFFRGEAEELVRSNTSARFIVVAAVYPGVRAAAAEEGLVLVLRQRYGVLTLRRRVELLRRLQRHANRNALLRASGSAGEDLQNPRVRPNPPD